MKFKIFLIDVLSIFITTIIILNLPKLNIAYNDTLRDGFIIALGVEISKLIWKINRNYISEYKPNFIFNYFIRKQVEKLHEKEDLIKRNEAIITKTFQKIQSDDRELKYLGVSELKQWSKQDNVDKCKISDELIKIIYRENDKYFKKVLLEIICSDYRRYYNPTDHEASPDDKK